MRRSDLPAKKPSSRKQLPQLDAIARMPIGQLRPRIIRQIHQHRPRPGRPAAIQIKAVITDHHHFARRHLPGFGQFQQTAGMRFGRRFIAAQHILHRKAVDQADGLQRDMGSSRALRVRMPSR